MSTNRSTRTFRVRRQSKPLPTILAPRVPSSPKRLRIGDGTCIIGSASDCDLCVADPTVSRKHASVSLVPEGVFVQDLQSRNGVTYLGQRVQSALVGPGSQFLLGAATISVELDRKYIDDAEVASGDVFRGMVGRSPSMHRLFNIVERLDGSLVPVLILGESGTGKELVARAIHEGSPCGDGPLVTLNCGAIPESLIASALFGHRRGAFTGANDARRGAFASAHGGTLFLDEIGEMPLSMQASLLRALETGEVTPVGQDTPQRLDVRIIAATNRDLSAEAADGRFRADLYFRLAVVTLTIASLRDRPQDVEPLALYLARQEGLPDLPPEILTELEARAWPGNVRELRNAIQAFTVLGILPDPQSAAEQGAPVDDAYIPHLDEAALAEPYADLKKRVVEEFTKRYLETLLARTNGNVSAVARLSQINRSHLTTLVERLGLRRRG